MLVLLLACEADPEKPGTEPLNLPEDPAETGVPVGVRTESWQGLTLEIWYPASDTTQGAPESVDFMAWVPDDVQTRIPDLSLPLVPSGAVRDAALRLPETPYPVVVFSHGFGGTRTQSLDYTVHLASRGYVVVATDHVGRRMNDVLPCMFTDMAGCDLSGFGSDAAVDDVPLLADWAEASAVEGFFAGTIDADTLGLAGHSAGGGTTVSVGDTDTRFDALMPMAAGGAPERDVPVLLLGATCDTFADDASMIAAGEALVDGDLVRVIGAGHLAPTDLCELDLLGVAETYLTGRDDVNEALLSQLIQLASDGCPGATPAVEGCSSYLPLTTSDPIVRHYATTFFDLQLRGQGPGVEAGLWAEAEVR